MRTCEQNLADLISMLKFNIVNALQWQCSEKQYLQAPASHMGHRTLNMLRRYTHLDAQITKKFSKTISEQILQGVSP